MKKFLKVLGVTAFTAALFFAVAVLAFYHLVRVGEFRRFLIAEIEQRTETKLELGEASLEVGKVVGVSFRNLALSAPEAAEPAITAERITARVALLPLLQRKLIFYEIRLHRPTLEIRRDKEGNIPVFDRILSLPFLQEDQARFSLDLHAIRLDDGAIDFYDGSGEGVPATHLRNLDLRLERIRGSELRKLAASKLSRPALVGAQPAALEFVVKGAVEREGRETFLRADGRIVFPEGNLATNSAWWDVEAQSQDLPASLVKLYAGARLPVQSIDGTLVPRLRLEGNLGSGLRVNGEVAFRQLKVDEPDLFSAPLTPGDGRAELDVTWAPGRLELARIDVHSQEIAFLLRGALNEIEKDETLLDLSLSAPFMPVAVIRKYLPWKLLQSARAENLAATVHDGELQINKAGVRAKLSEMRRWADSGLGEHVWFEAEARGVAVNFTGDAYLPLRAGHGRFVLENRILSFESVRGDYGQSRLVELEGRYRGIFSGPSVLELRGRGELELAEMREQLRLKLVPAEVRKLVSAVKELAGKGEVAVTVRKSGESPLQLEGEAGLEDVRLRTDDFSLDELKGHLLFSPEEIRGEKMTALLHGSPVEVRLVLRNYFSESGTFDLAVDSSGVRAGVLSRLLLSTGTLQDPGIVQGSISYYGALAPQGKRNFTGVLDLAGAQIAPQPLKQPLREVTGRIRIDEKGIDFQGLEGLIVGAPFDFSGRWRYDQEPELVFTFQSPTLDIGYLISQIDEESGDWYDNLQAEGKVSINKGKYEGFEFTGLKSDLRLDRRVWHLSNFAALSTGGTVHGVGTITDKPNILGFSVHPTVEKVPVKGFLRWFDIGTTEITGKVNLAGKLESTGKTGIERKKNLGGAFRLRIEDGTVRRMRMLVQILNLLDLSRWFTLQMPDINKEGIRFRAITGDFKVAEGVYSTDNLLVDSSDLRMTGAGTIDVPNDSIDFVVAVRPFPGVDTAINFIPLIGRGIAAIKNSFLVASFNIRGSIDDPTITPAPLSTLSEVFFGVLGIPKKMIGLPGAQDKQETDELAPQQTR